MILLGKSLNDEQNVVKILGLISGWDFEDDVGLDCGVEVWSKFWSWCRQRILRLNIYQLEVWQEGSCFGEGWVRCAISNVQTLCSRFLWTCLTSRRGVRIRGSRVRGGARCSRGSSMAPWPPTPVGCSASPAFRRSGQFITSYFCQNSFG